jgi:hypothetical protein
MNLYAIAYDVVPVGDALFMRLGRRTPHLH